MNWWGRVLGTFIGLTTGGLFGAILGYLLGYYFDKGMRQLEDGGVRGHGSQEVQAAFFETVFSVMGHLAKADGRVTEIEITAARQIMEHLRLRPEQQRQAIDLFNQGKSPDFSLEDAVTRFRQVCGKRLVTQQMLLEILIVIALADGDLHAEEQRILRKIATTLGFGERRFEALLAMAVAQQRYAGATGRQQRYAGGQQAPQGPTLQDAYRALGVDPSVSDAELKKAYRKLMSQHHPDKLIAKGVPEEMVALATDKAQEITAAYEQVTKARGL